MYEAIREAAEFSGPVGQGVAEMNDLRGFYGRLAAQFRRPRTRCAWPIPSPTRRRFVRITLPHFAER